MNNYIVSQIHSLTKSTLKNIFSLLGSSFNVFDIRSILMHILKQNLAWIITHDDYMLSDNELISFKQAITKLSQGIPVSYIVGVKEFYSREFVVTKDVLIPRPETELLVDQVTKLASYGAKVLDLGCGSGCIGISCKLERPDLCVTASDASFDALKIAKMNAYKLGAKLDFVCGDWFTAFGGNKTIGISLFDIVVSNPPYIKANDFHLANLKYEPIRALTDFGDGLGCYRIIIGQANKYLKPNGYLILEHGFDQSDSICELLHNELFLDIRVIKDYAGNDRLIIAKI